MKLPSLLGHFKSSGSKARALTIVIQTHVIYVMTEAMMAQNQEPLAFPIENDWESTLKAALTTGDYSGHTATVICCVNYYQSYQMDKPELPQEEWPSALPFLLKDMSGERVTDIVADATALPDGKKIQAFVLKKTILERMRDHLDEAGVILGRVVPEDAVWGYVKDADTSFMLLHRGPKGNFKIGAFVAQQNRFQRTIRGVATPVTNQAVSALQMDSLALELQRSTDYLSSQLRDAAIHQLFVCCDEEDQDELVRGLDDRLSVKVLPLVEDRQITSGGMLCLMASDLSPEGINLYPEHLKPKKEHFTLAKVVATWGGISLLMLAGYGYFYYSLSATEAELVIVQKQSGQQEKELKKLQVEAKNHRPTPSKLKAVERLEADIRAKQASMAAIRHYDESLQEGYSGVMDALALLGRNDISVSRIEMDRSTLNLTGLARSPGSVPAWIKQFKDEINLTGRTFEKLNMGRNENDVITFELMTRETAESQKEGD